MTQHKVIAEDSLSAMDEISKILGKDAVILKTNKVNGKIEILGSNNIEDIASSNAKKINKNKSKFSHLFSNQNLNEENKNRKLNNIIEKNNFTEINNSVVASENEFESVNNKFIDIETFTRFSNKLENLLQNMIIADFNDLEKSKNRSLKIELLKKGYSKKIISEFESQILIENGLDPELIFYHFLAKKLVTPYEEKILNSNIIFVNGSSGSGKTTLCSKIASYILDNKLVGNDRHKLSIINYAPKSSNHSELINFGRLLNLSVTSISDLEDIIKFIEANKENRKLIIDVSQENKSNLSYIHYLEKMMLNKDYLNIVTLQANSNKNMIKSTMEFYKNSFPTFGLTKLDESHISAEELSILGELNCKIGVLSGSTSIIGSLAFAKKEVLAQYMKDMSI